MSKYRPYPRRKLRALFIRWLQVNRLRVGVLIACALGLLILETLLLIALDIDVYTRWYVIGFVHAAVLSAVPFGIAASFIANEREAIWHVRGAWGEDFTREELGRARRKELIWGWVDSVTLQNGDIDHLVVTRSGGLVAIDSKWRSSTEHLDPEAMAQEARRARLRAEGVVHSMLKVERGSRRAAGKAFRISPLVVIWGPARESIPEAATVGGVDIIQGSGLVSWLKRLDGDRIDEASAADVLAHIERFRSSAWPAGTHR